MKNYHIKIQELILSDSSDSQECETFVYEPANPEEENLGNLYIIGCIKTKKNELDFLPNLIASMAKREFYSLKAKDPEISFENTLKKINASLLDLSKQHKNLKNHISFCIINTAKNKMQFSQIGENLIFLLRGNSLININQEKQQKNSFSSIVSGEIKPKDKFILTTAGFLKTLPKDLLKKILSNDIEKQAEIITNLYEKKPKEQNNLSEAIITFEITDQEKRKKIFKKRQEQTQRPRELKIPIWQKIHHSLYKLARKLQKKKDFIISVFVVLALVFSVSFYVKFQSKNKLYKSALQKTAQVEQLPEEKYQEAIDILNQAKQTAEELQSYSFLSKKAKDLQKKIEKKINELNGIYNIKDLERFGKITGRSFGFSPRFIFEYKGNVYVFSENTKAYYKIKSGQNKGRFIFPQNVNFEIERAFKKDGLVYFLNYAQNEVSYFDLEKEKFFKVDSEKELRVLLKEKPTPYNKTFNDISYKMDDNQIIKEEKDKKKYLNFLSLIRIRDFTVSEDDQYIYLLSEREVFKTKNR